MPRPLFASAACFSVALCLIAPTGAYAQTASSSGVQVHIGSGGGAFSAVPPGGDEGDRRRGRNIVVLGGGYGYNDSWALYNNRTFAPDSFNDWWHDRPDRNTPRWVNQNGNCERMWWSGGGWRC